MSHISVFPYASLTRTASCHDIAAIVYACVLCSGGVDLVLVSSRR